MNFSGTALPFATTQQSAFDAPKPALDRWLLALSQPKSCIKPHIVQRATLRCLIRWTTAARQQPLQHNYEAHQHKRRNKPHKHCKAHCKDTMPKVNPLTLEKWTPSDDETLQSVMAGKLPDVFRGSQPKPQPVPTPAAQWTAMAAHISAILDQTQDKRRFILHYPQQAPFQVAVMFDIAEPVKKCPAGVGDEGAPLMIARYRKHDPGWAPDEAKEAVVDFYKRQRDGFIREEAARRAAWGVDRGPRGALQRMRRGVPAAVRGERGVAGLEFYGPV